MKSSGFVEVVLVVKRLTNSARYLRHLLGGLAANAVIAMAVLLAPDTMLSKVRSPNALLSADSVQIEHCRDITVRPYCGVGDGVSEVSSAGGDIAAPDVFA